MKVYKEIVDYIREIYREPAGFIPLHVPVFIGNEKKYLEECIDSSFVSSVGKFVDEFEQKMAEYTGAKNAVVCLNGTNALYIALILGGVSQETEVITQPLTFIATANAISYCGAKPVFLDIDMATLGLSPDALSKWLQQNVDLIKSESNSTVSNLEREFIPVNIRTKRRISACVPMHTFGHPARIDEIIEICDNYNIPVIEDAAESLGSFYKGKHTGTFGKIGVLSFNGNKVLTTGGGGMLLFQDEGLANRAKHLTTQAKLPHTWEFLHDEIGYNYRMPNLNAALGLAQLEQLNHLLKKKHRIAKAYQDFFLNLNKEIAPKQNFTLAEESINTNTHSSTVQYISEPPDALSNYWLNCILMPDRLQRDEFLKYSNDNRVMTRPAWELMNHLQMFKDAQCGDLSNAEWIADRLVNIPSSPLNLKN